MKIGIQTWGSYGDIRPFVALAEGLQSSGHDVTLAITCIDRLPDDLSASRAGLKLQTVASPVIPDGDALAKIEQRLFSEPDPVKQTRLIIEQLFLPAEAAMYQAAVQLCAENDLVIGHFFHYPLQTAAEVSARPYISVALVHSTIPSACQPPAGMPDLGAVANRLAWRVVKSILNRQLKPYPDRLRIAHGLKPAGDLLADVWASGRLTLIAVSPGICERKGDWPDYYRVCGFLNRQTAAPEAAIAPELLAFLSHAEAPVYMTFGSAMSGGDPGETIALLREAADRASVRAIIQAPGWQEHGFACGDSLHFVETLPHEAVFPRCRAVVHHGGAGTTQSALLAGMPSVVVAHTSEQWFWGKELARLEVSSKPLRRRGLKASALAKGIRYAVDSAEVAVNAQRIAAGMRSEDGVATAIRFIEEAFRI